MPASLSILLSPRLLRSLFWLFAVAALAMALMPVPPHLPIDRFGDKAEHMLAFGTLALVANLAWRETSTAAIALRLSAFGALIEVLQAIPALHRDCDVRDWIADTVAIILATLVARQLRRALPEARDT
ncbi:MAG: VanZ family protein [Sphingomonadales bacterium]|nr:VanZ family protein [Sphingomonadales bacterium]